MQSQFYRAIMALAQPAEVQLALFPDFVCKGDELALDFEDGLLELGSRSELTAPQRTTVNALDALLTSISGKQNADFWTDRAVRSHPFWNEIRLAAKAVAEAFDWDLRPPPPSGAVYVPGGC